VAGTPVLPLPALVAFSQAILCCCEKKKPKQDSMGDAGVRYQEVWAQSGRLSATKFGGFMRAARPCS